MASAATRHFKARSKFRVPEVMIRRVLVTGATGFIGRQTLEPLVARGLSVHALARRPSTPLPQGVDFHPVDLHDGDAVAELVTQVRPDALLHLAWDVTPGRYLETSENLRWVQATLNLLQAFIGSGGRRAVCAGTAAEYDWRFGFCSEDLTPLRPASPYAACKFGVGEILLHTTRQVGLSFAWGRVFFLYGPHESPLRLVPSMIRSALAGSPIRLKNPDHVRDYLHVEDVGAAFASLLFSGVEGPVNIASGDPLRLRDIGRAVFRQFDMAEAFEDDVANSDAYPIVVGDIRRLRTEVGFQPRFSLETGMADMVNWWRENA
jgi:nucleoside-diphosphate-sugar epimerase